MLLDMDASTRAGQVIEITNLRQTPYEIEVAIENLRHVGNRPLRRREAGRREQ